MDDIYIKLMNCLLDKKIDKYSSRVSQWNDCLKKSCNKLNEILSLKGQDYKLSVGIDQLSNNSSFLEPCPIAYSANPDMVGKEFKMAFIGLNPHKEDAFFDPNITWEQLAKFHCPDNCLDSVELNMYRRVYGNMQYKINKYMKWETDSNGERKKIGVNKRIKKWSPYYKAIYYFHRAIFENKFDISEWNKIMNSNCAGLKSKVTDDDLAEFVLKKITDYPIINAEFIPYKSIKFSNLSKTGLENLMKNENYKNYLITLLKFIDDNMPDKSWIIFNGMTDKTIKILEQFDEILKNEDISILPNGWNLSEDKNDSSFSIVARGYRFYCFDWKKNGKIRHVLLTPFMTEQILKVMKPDEPSIYEQIPLNN